MTDAENTQEATLSGQHFGNILEAAIFLFLYELLEVRVNVTAANRKLER